jgi:diadenosine tetraphosphate (Ap4A) HIT family hydrolase
MSSRMTESACPFCQFILTERPIAQRGTFFAKYDSYPVSPGHVLLIPRRHVDTLFELDPTEREDLFDLLLEVRGMLESEYSPDGFNVGVNIGHAAGQTVMHLHIHVIPRYLGDIDHPEGGVRAVIPHLAKYPHDTA